MKIIKKVLIKQIVTEKSKEKLYTKFIKQKMQLEQESQQLLFEQKKLQRKENVSKQAIAERFQFQVKERKEKIALITFKLEQLDILEIGSEITENEVEALVEVREGLHWDKIMNGKSIVIKDGIVIRIDE